MKRVLFLIALLLVLPVMCSAGDVEVQDSGVKQGNAIKLNFTGDTTCTFSQDTATIDVDSASYTNEVYVGTSTDTVTAADDMTRYISATADTVTYILPAAAAGLEYQFVAGQGEFVQVDTLTTADTIKYLGLDAGDKLKSAGATGDSVTVASNGSNTWYVVGMGSSAWTDGGAG